jgi:GGDEF domain-containing protein
MEQSSELAEIHFEWLYELVDQMKFAQSKEHVDEVIMSYIGSAQFGDLRYYSQGKAYSPMGDEVEHELSGHEMIIELSQSNAAGCTDVYFDERAQLDCIAFFVPVRGSVYVDGVLSIVPVKDIISVGEVLQEKTSVVAVVGNNGAIYSSIAAEGFSTNVGANFYDFADAFTGNKEMVDLARTALYADELTSVEITAAGIRYTLVAEPIEVFDDYLHLVTISVSETLINTEVGYIRHIVNILVLAIVAFTVGLVYAFLLQKKIKESMSAASLTEAVVECANAEGFRRSAMNLVYGSGRHYAVGVYSIRQFHYVEDTFGKEQTVEVLKFTAHVLSTFCSKNETYGYLGNGNFVVLIDYTDESVFRDKLMLFENIVNKYDVLVENNVKLKFAAGICLGFTGRRRTIPEMIDCAAMVCEEAKSDVKTPFVVYTDVVRDKISRNEEVEAKMESALEQLEELRDQYN